MKKITEYIYSSRGGEVRTFEQSYEWEYGNETKYYFFLPLDMPIYDEQIELLERAVNRSLGTDLMSKIVEIRHDGYGSFMIKLDVVDVDELIKVADKIIEWYLDMPEPEVEGLFVSHCASEGHYIESYDSADRYTACMKNIFEEAGYSYDEQDAEDDAETWLDVITAP